MRLVFFGRLADLNGGRYMDGVPDDFVNGEALRAWLSDTAPHLSGTLGHPGTRLLLDDTIVDWQTPLAEKRHIAIIPVCSGG